MSLSLIQGDTFPGWTFWLNDTNGWMPLAGNVSAVKLAGKGTNTSTVIGPVTASVTAENSFTANTTASSNQLTSVSSFTGISNGVTITLPISVAQVVNGVVTPVFAANVNSGAGTLSLVDANGNPVNASANGSGVACVANRGTVIYTPTSTDTATADVYPMEAGVHWTAGGFQHVPSDPSKRPSITISGYLVTGE